MGCGYYGGSFQQYKENPKQKTPIWRTIVFAWFVAGMVIGLGFLLFQIIAPSWR